VRLRRRILICMLIVAAGGLFNVAQALATTHISGATYTSNTEWTTSGSPYVLDGSVQVNSGVTLTIDPGVIVKLNGTFRAMYIYGTLDAAGTSGSHVTITSYQDDSAGGDTNGDGSATSGAAGQWYSLFFESGSTGTFSYTDVTYGGWGFAGYTGAELDLMGSAQLTFDHSSATYSQTSGILAGSGSSSSPWPTATISHSTLSHNLDGAFANQGTLVLDHNNYVESNSADGLGFAINGSFSGTASTVYHSQIDNNGRYGIYYTPGYGTSLSVEPTGEENNIYGNGTKEIYDSAYEPWLDWTYNYLGDFVTIDWQADCGVLPHLAYLWSPADPPDGPVYWVEIDHGSNNGTVKCAFDHVEDIPYYTSARDNSGS
jgi:hypothetical protein